MRSGTLIQWLIQQDPAIEDAKAAVGTQLTPVLAWAKTKSEDGTSYSVLLKPDPAPDDLLERIRDAFDGIATVAPVAAPETIMADLLTVYPLMDVHMGMYAWGAETGGTDYDVNITSADMRHAFAKIAAITPASAEAVLIVGGDFFHSDDTKAETPQSKHRLDVDGRFYKVVDAGVSILRLTIDALLQKHARVEVRILRGNHDEHSHVILTFALAAHYATEPRASVIKDPRDLYQRQWGRCAIFAHHGDKAKPQPLALYLSDACPFWSATRHRHFFSGHTHQDQAKDLGPLRWESLRAFCPPDAYAASMGYGGRRALQSVTFHKTDGLILRALDPIERQVA